ncbi:MAG: DNA mismatch repair protein, partial [Lachnospiraceae bacterium]|nr:DNA mismatch repair protein [Lachnospiraceae bacterium]
MKISLLFPNHDLKFVKLGEESLHDIGMDSVINRLTKKESEQTYIRNVMSMITDDVANAVYRCDIFDDIYRNPGMRTKLL